MDDTTAYNIVKTISTNARTWINVHRKRRTQARNQKPQPRPSRPPGRSEVFREQGIKLK